MKHEFKVIPKEEILSNRSNAYEFINFDKKETLEEIAERLYPTDYGIKSKDIINIIKQDTFIKGAKWSQERSYSEEDMRECWMACLGFNKPDKFNSRVKFEQWFEIFSR